MTEETILVLTEMLIKEHENKTESKYIFTKEELIRFCIKFMKIIEQNEKI